MTLAIIIDLIIVAIVALFTFLGYKQGLIKVAVKLVATLIAIVITLILYKPVSVLIVDNTDIDEQIQTTITNKLIPEDYSESNESSDELLLNVDALSDLIIDNSKNTVQGISEVISIKLIELVVMIVLFIVAKILLKFITFLADLIAKLPVLNQINKLGGTIYGVLKGFILVFSIFAVISLAAPLIGQNFIENINQSYIGSFMYNNNLLLKIIF